MREDMTGSDYFGDLDVHMGIILKWTLRTVHIEYRILGCLCRSAIIGVNCLINNAISLPLQYYYERLPGQIVLGRTKKKLNVFFFGATIAYPNLVRRRWQRKKKKLQ
jgi:hypothetical protein